MKKSISLLSLKMSIILSTLLTTAAFAGDAEVTIAIELNPMGSFEATSSTVSGALKKKGTSLIGQNIVLDLRTLDSGIELRDKHMKEEYFQTGRFPKAVLIKAVGRDGKFAGILMVRNVKNKITGTYKVDGNIVEAEFATPMSAYKIKKAAYMGVGVENTIKVKVKIPIAG